MRGDLVPKPSVGGRWTRGQAAERRVEIADDLMGELDRWRDIDGIDIDLQERHIADPGFVFDFDGVVAEPDNEVGGAQNAALHLAAGALDAAE